METNNSTTSLRDRILPGYLYTINAPSGPARFVGVNPTREYYDTMIKAGDSPETILETIVIHADQGSIQLSKFNQNQP